MSEKEDYLDMIWAHLGNTGTTDKAEMALDMKEQLMSRKLSKLICYHNSEWGADYSSLETEVSAYYDRCIEQVEDKAIKKSMQDEKLDDLEALKKQVTNLDFWKDVKVVVNDNNGMPSDTIEDPFNNMSRQRSPWEMDSIPPDDEKDKQSLFPFPTSSKVYHFHPIAFVEQMKRHATCFCNKDITVEAFEKIFGNGPWFTGKLGCVNMKTDYPDMYKISTLKLVDALNATMNKYEINTCLQKAHSLGQIGGETGFQYTAECANGDDYDPGSHRKFHNNFSAYIVFLNKYTSGANISKSIKVSQKPAEIKESLKAYKKAYTDYETATSTARLTDAMIALKDKHDAYLNFKTEKEKYDTIYTNSYKRKKLKNNATAQQKKEIVYKNWRSAYYRYTVCINNGNTEDGDGKKYRGHGMLQLTWKNSYVDFKNRLNIDIVSNSKLLSSDITNACNMGGSWWKKPLTGAGNLNKRADTDDMIYVAYGINGGLNGLAHRYKYTRKAVDCLGCKECGNYKHLTLGDYTYENSKIKNVFKDEGDVNYIKQELKNGQKDYEAEKI